MRGLDYGMLRDFFFLAMGSGWASGREGEDVLGMPGQKRITYTDGALCLMDQWMTTPTSHCSAGTTTIWFQGMPIWTMSYEGSYEPEAIPVVRAALMEVYRQNIFAGGRGPATFVLGGLSYFNRRFAGGIDLFSGGEEVRSSAGDKSYGYHNYRGMALVDLK